MMRGKISFFIHIPKCCGMTVREVLARNHLDGSLMFINVPHRVDVLEELTLEIKYGLSCVAGHFYFGVHRYFKRKPVYFTFLRDPIQRIVSHYHFVRREKKHHLHEASKPLTLAEYAASAFPSITNAMTKMVSGAGLNSTDPRMLAVAKENIEKHFCFVGFCERFDESLKRLQEIFGWKNLGYKKQNVGGYKRGPVSKGVVAKIKACNELDIKLYDWTRKRFNG